MLHRYWFSFDGTGEVAVRGGLRVGCGVTAYGREDALQILRRQVFEGGPIPKVTHMIKDVDVRMLDQGHVLPNMEVVVVRGVWFPRGYAFLR